MASRKPPANPTLPHVDSKGAAFMVNVGRKPESERRAVASCQVRMSAGTLKLIAANQGAKGDVLGVARVAALSALKRTSDLIPLCHPVRVVGSEVHLALDPKLPGVRIECVVDAFDRTGVEMEAMVGASVAALTIYDMIKGVDRGAFVESVALQHKSGGKSGVWDRPAPRRP